MPRQVTKRLTAAAVRNAKPGTKLNDGNGLFLFTKKSCAQSWVQRLTIKGKRRDIGLGPTSLVSLAEARELAIDNRRTARNGGDPLQDKREAKAADHSFEEVARMVFERKKKSWDNPKHGKQWIATLENYVLPKIGRRHIGEVTSSDVMNVLEPIWHDKQETARRVKQRIGVVLKYAIAQGWRLDNPVDAVGQGLGKQNRKPVHHRSLPYKEVSGCINAVHESNAGVTTKLALEFLILTASRSGEMRFAEWSEIDFDNKEWTRPASRMKSKEEHTVPLSPRAVEILREAQALSDDSDLIFPSTKYGKPLSDATIGKLVRELGFDCVPHGFRTSFRTWVQEKTRTEWQVAEACLAHVIKDDSARAYAQSELVEKRRPVMNKWATYLATDAGAKVVALVG